MQRMVLLPLALWLALVQGPTAQGAQFTHDFAKWENEISAFEAMDRTNPPPEQGVLFIGSSTIRLWKSLVRDFPEHRVINRGFGGSEIVDSTHFADRIVFPYKPRMVVLRAGGNDINGGKSAQQVFVDFTEFVSKIRSRLPGTEIVYISLCPSPARWQQAREERVLNGLIQDFARRTAGVKYVETYDLSVGPDGKPRPELFVEDKLHFNTEGYELLAKRVRPFLAVPAAQR
jgi:lysophospholipase L1-like esterase